MSRICKNAFLIWVYLRLCEGYQLIKVSQKQVKMNLFHPQPFLGLWGISEKVGFLCPFWFGPEFRVFGNEALPTPKIASQNFGSVHGSVRPMRATLHADRPTCVQSQNRTNERALFSASAPVANKLIPTIQITFPTPRNFLREIGCKNYTYPMSFYLEFFKTFHSISCIKSERFETTMFWFKF